MYDTVLIPSDGSEHAVRAAEHGVYLARAFDATVHLLNVVDIQAAAGPFNAGGVSEAFVERLESDGRAAIEAADMENTPASKRVAMPSGSAETTPI